MKSIFYHFFHSGKLFLVTCQHELFIQHLWLQLSLLVVKHPSQLGSHRWESCYCARSLLDKWLVYSNLTCCWYQKYQLPFILFQKGLTFFVSSILVLLYTMRSSLFHSCDFLFHAMNPWWVQTMGSFLVQSLMALWPPKCPLSRWVRYSNVKIHIIMIYNHIST